jgi:hypothetical protein
MLLPCILHAYVSCVTCAMLMLPICWQIPTRVITPTSFLVRVDPIRPRTGVVHALQIQVVDSITDSMTEQTLFDGFTVGKGLSHLGSIHLY